MGIINLSTEKEEQVIDVTKNVKDAIKSLNVKDGLCVVYTPHTSAAIFTNENWDLGIADDIINSLSKLVPKKQGYKHDKVDGNAHSHIKSILIGPSQSYMVVDGKLVLGQWQGIMFCELDGPRNRQIYVEVYKK